MGLYLELHPILQQIEHNLIMDHQERPLETPLKSEKTSLAIRTSQRALEERSRIHLEVSYERDVQRQFEIYLSTFRNTARRQTTKYERSVSYELANDEMKVVLFQKNLDCLFFEFFKNLEPFSFSCSLSINQPLQDLQNTLNSKDYSLMDFLLQVQTQNNSQNTLVILENFLHETLRINPLMALLLFNRSSGEMQLNPTYKSLLMEKIFSYEQSLEMDFLSFNLLRVLWYAGQQNEKNVN